MSHPFLKADLLDLAPLPPVSIERLFALARRMKADPSAWRSALDGRTIALLFEKPSLRTRVSFEAGIGKLGGRAIFLDHANQRLGERESVADYARNLERWVDAIVARVFKQRVIEELAAASSAPVINALSDRFHPCQALADLFTLAERFADARGDAVSMQGRGVKIAYIGDGNNVCHSLMQCATKLGVSITLITPQGYEPSGDVARDCAAYAATSGCTLEITNDAAAVKGSHAVYTDVWVSMGQSDQAVERHRAFNAYQVNSALMNAASAGLAAPSLFMHCLPAQRGVEVTDEVIDSPSSVVYDQAENRMHVQNALLAEIFGAGERTSTRGAGAANREEPRS